MDEISALRDENDSLKEDKNAMASEIERLTEQLTQLPL